MRVNEEIAAMQTHGLNTVDHAGAARIIGTGDCPAAADILFRRHRLIAAQHVLFPAGHHHSSLLRQLNDAVTGKHLDGGMDQGAGVAFVIARSDAY